MGASHEWVSKKLLSLSLFYRREEQGGRGRYLPCPAVGEGQDPGPFSPGNLEEIQQTEDLLTGYLHTFSESRGQAMWSAISPCNDIKWFLMKFVVSVLIKAQW